MDEYFRRELAEAIRYATMAPSTHNTQPWKFAIHEGSICLLPDLSRQLPVGDPSCRELYISLGCALENLVVALTYMGHGPVVTLFPPEAEEECIRIGFRGSPRRANQELFEAITKRQTNRTEYESRPISEGDWSRLRDLPLEPGVRLHLTGQKDAMARVVQLVMDADEVQMSGEYFREELIHWIRFNASEARRARDGLGSESIGTPSGPRWLGKLFMRHSDLAKARAERDKRLVESSAAIALFSTTEDDKTAWVSVGRSFERMALWGTVWNIQHAHLNQPIEIPDLRSEVSRRLELAEGYPQLLLRLGYAKPTAYSLRRPVEDVLIETEESLMADDRRVG